MTDYMTKREWTTWKTRLTKAQNRAKRENTEEAWDAVMDVSDAFFAREDDVALPDDWTRFSRAFEDARFAVARLNY